MSRILSLQGLPTQNTGREQSGLLRSSTISNHCLTTTKQGR
jgi:hypothetical protein